MIPNTPPEIRTLKPPNLDKDCMTQTLAQLRPYRQNGIRLQREVIKGKSIYHNYGHGGAGGSVFYGLASLLIGKFEKQQEDSKNKTVAVIGSGWMGIFTALILAEQGYQVNIYTQYVPTDINTELDGGNPKTASQVSGALVNPLGYPIVDPELHKVSSILTFNFLQNLKEKENYPYIHMIDCYELSEQNDYVYFQKTPQEILLEPKEVFVDFGNGKLNQGRAWKTYIIDSDYMLRDYVNKLKKIHNVKFIFENFSSLEDVLKLEEKTIFNCLGLSSGQIFNDPNVIPVQGHHIYLKPTPGADYSLFSNHLGSEEYMFHLFNRFDRIIYGGTFQKGEASLQTEKDQIEKMKQNLFNYFQDRTLNPKL